MKQTLSLFLLLFIYFILTCCKKNSSLSIIGKWKIVNDSTKISGNGSFPASHSNYIGQENDYYDFRSDGNLYVKEGSALDTMAYEVHANNQVSCVPDPGFTSSYNTTFLTATQATLMVSGYTMEGQLIKIVNLKK